MSDNIQDAIKDIIEGGADAPDRVTNRLLLAAIIHNSEQNDITNAQAEETNTLIREQNSRISKLELQASEFAKNPSLTWLIKNDPRSSLRILLIVTIILIVINSFGTQIMPYILALVGIHIP